jgi:hypothetical protein
MSNRTFSEMLYYVSKRGVFETFIYLFDYVF